MLTQKRLKKLFNYDPLTGLFTRLLSTSNRVKVGDIAGSLNGRGYLHINIDGKFMLNHRLSFLYMTGKIPIKVDHEDHIKINNIWKNLRSATPTTNNMNMSIRSDNKSGFTGVCWNEKRSKWESQIRLYGKNKHLGYFKNKKNAITARKAANIKYGFHKNHGMKKQ